MIKKWNYVSVPQCFGIMIVSIICLIAALIPATLSPMAFSYAKILSTEEDSLIKVFTSVFETGFPAIVPLDSSLISTIAPYLTYVIYGYYVIIALNIFCALLLALTRANALRKFFRFFSVIFGIALILFALIYIAYLVAAFGYMSATGIQILEIIPKTYALYAFGMILFSIVLAFKQFEWFTSPV